MESKHESGSPLMRSQTDVIAFVGKNDNELDSVCCLSIIEAQITATIMGMKRANRHTINCSFLLDLEEDFSSFRSFSLLFI